MQAAIGWVVWFLSIIGIIRGPLWQITLVSPQNGQVIVAQPNNTIAVNGGFYRKGSARPPLKGTVSCNGVSGTINTTQRTWQVPAVPLNPGTNTITCDYKEKRYTSRVQISVIYQGGEVLPPIAQFHATPLNGEAPLNVSFDASGSHDPDGGAIASFEWNFGDGTMTTTASQVINHTYTTAGSYTASLQVRDDEGVLSDPVTQTIKVFAANLPPIARIHASPTAGHAPLLVNFDGASSSDPDGSISRYAWSFPDGSSSEEAQTSFTFTQGGSFTVTLTVWDDKNVPNSTSVQIQVQADEAGPLLAISPQDGATIVTTTPTFTLTYEDQQSGVDTNSIKVLVDGVDLSQRLSTTPTEAVLAFSSDFPLSNGEHQLRFEVKDIQGNLSILEAEYTVDDGTTLPASYIAGRVTLPDGTALSGVTITKQQAPIGEINDTTQTDQDGKFALSFVAGGDYQLRYSLSGHTSAIKNVSAIAGLDSATDVVILKPVDPQVTPIVASSGGVAINSTGTVSVSIPAGALSSDAEIILTEAKAGIELPYALPELSDFTFAVDHAPDGLSFSTPVTVEIANDLGFPAGAQLPLGITDNNLGQWVDSGRVATVSPDGSKIVYQMDHFSSSDANPGGIPIGSPVSSNPSDNQSNGGGNQPPKGPSCGGSIIKGSNCSLGTQVTLPAVMRHGKSFAIALRYNSDTVRPLLVASTVNEQDHLQLSEALGVVSNLKIGPVTSVKEFTGNTNTKPSVMKDILPAQDTQGEFMRTGSYPMEHELGALYDGEYAETPYFGGPVMDSFGVPTRQPVVLKEKLESRSIVQNQLRSPFGAGWMMEGLERLHEASDGSVFFEDGEGSAQVFLPLGTSGGNQNLTKTDHEVSDVLVHDGFMWVSSCQGNVVEQRTLEGRVHKEWNMPCPTRLTPTRRGGILVVVDNGSRIVRLTQNGLEKRLYAKSLREQPISAIAEDGALAVHFITGTDVKTVSPHDGSIFHYVGNQGLIKAGLQAPTDIQIDSYDNLVVVDSAQNKIFKIFPKTREVRTILGKEDPLTTPPLPVEAFKRVAAPVRLIRDSKLKRFFVLENSGQLWHWQGVGHKRIDPVTFESGGLRSGKVKNKRQAIQVFAYSPETGPIIAQGSNLWFRRPSQKDAGDVSYQSPVMQFSSLTKKVDGSFERIEVDQTKTIYNAQGFMTAKILPDGQAVSYQYSDGKITQMTTPAGDHFQFNYDGRGYLSGIVDPAGRETNFTVDSDGNLTQVELPDNTQKQFTYDQDHLLTQESDEEGRLDQYFYRDGRVTQEIYPGGRIRNISPALFVGISTNKEGPSERITLESQISEFVSPEGRSTGMQLDESGMIERLYNPDGSFTLTTRFTGLPYWEVTAEGRKVFRNFDERGRVIREENAQGNTWTTYDPTTGKPSTITDQLGRVTTISYNQLAQIESITDRRGEVTSFTYHPNGTIATITNAKNEVTSYEVDNLGNTTAIIDHLNNRTEYTLDDAGNVIEVTDPKGQKTSMTRDEKGRVLTITTPLNGTTTFTYTATGKLATLTDARGKTTSWTYNEQDLVERETNPLGHFEEYSYDQDGLMTERRLRDGAILRYEYDQNARLKKIISPSDEVVWDYDQDGLPINVTDSDSQVGWSYDGVGRLIKEVQTFAPAPLRFSYNSMGQLVRRTMGGQISEVLGYDNEGLLDAMTYQHFSVSRSLKFVRDELGRAVTQRFNNGAEVTRSFDGMGRLASLATKNRQGATVGSFDFTYDPNSNITLIDQLIDGTTTEKSYQYDGENRLTRAEHGTSIEVWNLDLLGNWLGGGRIYSDWNQILEDQEFFYSYDQRGNLVQKSAKLGQEVQEFEWDYFDRLVQVRILTDGVNTSKRVSYKYDPTGRRIERLEEDLTNSSSKTNRWAYLKDDQWIETDGAGQVLAVTLNGETIDDIISATVSNTALDPIKDHLGSIYGWTNAATGAVIQKQSYTAYGETTIEQSSPLLEQLGSLRGYTSRELDQATGLYFYRARWYDSKLGKFISVDPIGFEGDDESLYRYVANGPVVYRDSFGYFKLVTPVTPITSFLSLITGGPPGLNTGEQQLINSDKNQQNYNNFIKDNNLSPPGPNSSPVKMIDPNAGDPRPSFRNPPFGQCN